MPGPGVLFVDGDGGRWMPIGWTTTGVQFSGDDLDVPEFVSPRPVSITVTLDERASEGLRQLWMQIRKICHPRPLCIDGREYRRRTRRRRP